VRISWAQEGSAATRISRAKQKTLITLLVLACGTTLNLLRSTINSSSSKTIKRTFTFPLSFSSSSRVSCSITRSAWPKSRSLQSRKAARQLKAPRTPPLSEDRSPPSPLGLQNQGLLRSTWLPQLLPLLNSIQNRQPRQPGPPRLKSKRNCNLSSSPLLSK